jgi:hypothetical protein
LSCLDTDRACKPGLSAATAMPLFLPVAPLEGLRVVAVRELCESRRAR